MSLEAQFLNAAVTEEAERGERARFADALAVFEDMHRVLKARLADTPEHRALDGLAAVLALVTPGERRTGRQLDLDGFAAFRSSVEVLHDNTPEARALQLFEGALRSMIASAPDFDDLPDAGEEPDAAAEETANAEEADDQDHAETDAVLHDDTVADETADHAAEDHARESESEGDNESEAEGDGVTEAAEPAAEEPEPEEEAAQPEAASDDSADGSDETQEGVSDNDDEGDPATVRQRIAELEAELAAARASQAA